MTYPFIRLHAGDSRKEWFINVAHITGFIREGANKPHKSVLRFTIGGQTHILSVHETCEEILELINASQALVELLKS